MRAKVNYGMPRSNPTPRNYRCYMVLGAAADCALYNVCTIAALSRLEWTKIAASGPQCAVLDSNDCDSTCATSGTDRSRCSSMVPCSVILYLYVKSVSQSHSNNNAITIILTSACSGAKFVNISSFFIVEKDLIIILSFYHYYHFRFVTFCLSFCFFTLTRQLRINMIKF